MMSRTQDSVQTTEPMRKERASFTTSAVTDTRTGDWAKNIKA